MCSVCRFIQAFDSINHDVLFKFLGKFGIPDRVIMIVMNLYKKSKIKLTVENTEEENLLYILVIWY